MRRFAGTKAVRTSELYRLFDMGTLCNDANFVSAHFLQTEVVERYCKISHVVFRWGLLHWCFAKFSIMELHSMPRENKKETMASL